MELERIPDRSPALRIPSDQELVDEFLASFKPSTRKAYDAALRQFATWLQVPVQAAVAELLGYGGGAANRLASGWSSGMRAAGLSAATIRLRLTALAAVCKSARLVGRIAWSLEAPRPKATASRIIHEPGLEGWRAMVSTAQRRRDRKGRRDYALICLLHDLGLRLDEARMLDLGHVERTPAPQAVWILGKGRDARERIALPPRTAVALADWIEIRGFEEGPLFVALDPGAVGSRLSAPSVWRVVRAIGRAAGVARPVSPHLLRHRHGTRGAELGVPLLELQRGMRHGDPKTTGQYVHYHSDPTPRINRLISED